MHPIGGQEEAPDGMDGMDGMDNFPDGRDRPHGEHVAGAARDGLERAKGRAAATAREAHGHTLTPWQVEPGLPGRPPGPYHVAACVACHAAVIVRADAAAGFPAWGGALARRCRPRRPVAAAGEAIA